MISIRTISEKFKFAGQNLARRGNTLQYENIPEAIARMIYGWFDEYQDANMDYILAYKDHEEGYLFHFNLVNSKITSSSLIFFLGFQAKKLAISR